MGKSTKFIRKQMKLLGHAAPIGICLLLLLSACRDHGNKTITQDERLSPDIGTKKELILDSIFLYAQQLYRWQESLPSYTDFTPRKKFGSISPEQTAYERELFAISQYSLAHNGKPYEWSPIEGKPKYSYLERRRNTKKSSGHLASMEHQYKYATHLSYWTSGKKYIAYLYIASFPELAIVKTELDRLFKELSNKQVTHLILDLRHNGGGYVETAEYLANLIVPQKLDGKIMFSEQFHPNVQNGKATLLGKQPYLDANGNPVQYKGRSATLADVDYSEKANTHYFVKKGVFNTLQHLSFIVSGRTASASELLISSFKPYFPVRLIGQKTFGKPVGFFSLKIDAFDIYFASFLIRNANGWSDYFDGMSVDISLATPKTDLHIGNPKEPWLASTLQDIVSITDSKLEKGVDNIKDNPPFVFWPETIGENLLFKTNFQLKN
ncbi:peptidase S41-like protein [Sphingobacterium sp. JUb20]|nr:peptidase S41-like protein [Sphingobacterium sp. JUb20]